MTRRDADFWRIRVIRDKTRRNAIQRQDIPPGEGVFGHTHWKLALLVGNPGRFCLWRRVAAIAAQGVATHLWAKRAEVRPRSGRAGQIPERRISDGRSYQVLSPSGSSPSNRSRKVLVAA
jgi:hypothetical protein